MEEFDIGIRTRYVHNEVHRNQTPDKGQWNVTKEDERASFKTSFDEDWLESTEGWGLHIVSDKAAYLGTDRNGNLAFFAVFVDKSTSGVWHGFPATPLDSPSPNVIKSWLSKGLVRKKALKSLTMGQLCNL